MDHITKTVKTQRTLISRLQRYNTILLSVAQKIRLYLHHLLLFSVSILFYPYIIGPKEGLYKYLKRYQYLSSLLFLL